MSDQTDPTAVAILVARAFERAGVDYAVGGSVASSAYGEPRATRDLDFAVKLTDADVPTFLDVLGPDFAVDQQSLREMIQTGGTVNIFYLPLFTKIDLFLRGDDEYDRAEFSRRCRIEPLPGEEIMASSAEDNLLWKLRWYRKGGEASDQQWRDILGILRVSGATIELEYLRKWAGYHGVSDLLDRAMRQREIRE